jgi:hypothetical protein
MAPAPKNTGAKSGIPAESLEQYERLVATSPGVPRKGATVPYTSINGNMFSYLQPSGLLALRLPAAERERFLNRYDSSLVEAYGIVQTEYVSVPEALLARTDELKPWFEISYRYAGTLKAKPTKRTE